MVGPEPGEPGQFRRPCNMYQLNLVLLLPAEDTQRLLLALKVYRQVCLSKEGVLDQYTLMYVGRTLFMCVCASMCVSTCEWYIHMCVCARVYVYVNV